MSKIMCCTKDSKFICSKPAAWSAGMASDKIRSRFRGRHRLLPLLFVVNSELSTLLLKKALVRKLIIGQQGRLVSRHFNQGRPPNDGVS